MKIKTKLRKLSSITVVSTLILNSVLSNLTVFAEEIQPRGVTVSQVGSSLSYIGDRHGNMLKFPKKKMSDGSLAYCLEHKKKTPSNISYTEGGTLDNGIKYILEYNPNTGNADLDYYIKQSAVHYYLGQINWIQYATKGTDIRDKVVNLVAQAKGVTLRELVLEDKNTKIVSENKDSISVKAKNPKMRIINEDESVDTKLDKVSNIKKIIGRGYYYYQC